MAYHSFRGLVTPETAVTLCVPPPIAAAAVELPQSVEDMSLQPPPEESGAHPLAVQYISFFAILVGVCLACNGADGPASSSICENPATAREFRVLGPCHWMQTG